MEQTLQNEISELMLELDKKAVYEEMPSQLTEDPLKQRCAELELDLEEEKAKADKAAKEHVDLSVEIQAHDSKDKTFNQRTQEEPGDNQGIGGEQNCSSNAKEAERFISTKVEQKKLDALKLS